MKGKLICLVGMFVWTTNAQGQDFASRFMLETSKDASISCETISPKMLETLIKMHDGNKDENASLISKLKSVRIIHVPKRSKAYFKNAEALLDKNKNRFTEVTEARNAENKKIFLRKKDELILELVLLNLDTLQNKLTIINLTGEMDQEFIEDLSENEGI